MCCIFFDVAYIFFFLIFEIIKLQKLLLSKKNSFRDVTLYRNGPGRDILSHSGTVPGNPSGNTFTCQSWMLLSPSGGVVSALVSV